MTYQEERVKLARHMQRMRVGAPARMLVWKRWLEPIERIVKNGHGIDAAFYYEDWEPWPGCGIDEEEFFEAREAGENLNDKYGRDFFFKEMLDSKRQDEHYDAVLDSLRTRGFVRPLTVLSDPGTSTGYKFGDGGHRLAAAADLGYTHVPVQMVPEQSMGVCKDSGEWGYDYYAEDRLQPVSRSLRAMLR